MKRTDQDKPAEASQGDQPTASSGARRVVHSRRLLAGASISAAVLTTLSSRSALANHCTVSGMLSGNLSRPHDGVTCKGGTPGYWKNHPSAWPSYVPGPCNPLSSNSGDNCNDYSIPKSSKLDKAVTDGDITQAERDAYEAELISNPGTPFLTVFPGLPTDPGDLTLMQALWKDAPAPYDPPSLVAHMVSAVMNANFWGRDQFGYTEAGIVAFINAGIGNPSKLMMDLTALNEREHPF